MELLITLIVLTVCIATNLMVFQTLRKLRSSEVLTSTLEVTEGCGCHCAPLEVEELPPSPGIAETPLPVPLPKVVDESYYAWKNSTGEPTAAPPSPHGPPPKPGPLERPYGFSR